MNLDGAGGGGAKGGCVGVSGVYIGGGVPCQTWEVSDGVERRQVAAE